MILLSKNSLTYFFVVFQLQSFSVKVEKWFSGKLGWEENDGFFGSRCEEKKKENNSR